MLLVLQANMPGLLQSTDSGVASFKFVAAFFAELIGVLIFTLYGSAVASTYGPWGNGITLAVLGRSRSWISETRHLRRDRIAGHAVMTRANCVLHMLQCT